MSGDELRDSVLGAGLTFLSATGAIEVEVNRFLRRYTQHPGQMTCQELLHTQRSSLQCKFLPFLLTVTD